MGGVFVGVRCDFTTMAIERTVNILSVFSAFPCHDLWGDRMGAPRRFDVFDQTFCFCDAIDVNNEREHGYSFDDDTVVINGVINGKIRKETIRQGLVVLWQTLVGNLLCANDNYSIHDAKVFLDRQMAFVTHYSRFDNSHFVLVWRHTENI